MNEFSSLFKTALEKNRIAIPEETQYQIQQFIQLMLRWNNVYNLTSITNLSDIVHLHLIDSLLIGPYLNGNCFLDVGSGAGFPALPFAISHPQQQWTLIDKVQKKTRFLTQVCLDLGLKNVTVLHQNILDLKPAVPFDCITARALSSCHDFLRMSAHCGDHHTKWIAMKGHFPKEELSMISDEFILLQSKELNIANCPTKRHVLIFEKSAKPL